MKDEVQSGTLARSCGVSADTIRHYENLGLIAATRGANGYRYFPSATVARVQLIRRALSIGFSLVEMQRILVQRDSGAAPCRGVRALAQTKLSDLDARIAELIAMRGELSDIIDEWDERLAATPDGEPALLLERTKNDEHDPLLVAPGRRSGHLPDARRAHGRGPARR
jgi:DNA-binding transcriptional MerR regulator